MRREIEASGGEFVGSIGGNISEARAAEEGYRISVVRKLMGDSGASTIYFGRFATPEDMKRASYFPEASVYEWFDSFGGRRTFDEVYPNFGSPDEESNAAKDAGQPASASQP